MKDIFNKFVITGRIGVVVFALVVLGFSSFTAIEKIFCLEETLIGVISEQDNGIAGPPVPEETTENMATDGRAGSPESSCLLAPLVLKTENNSSRLKIRRTVTSTIDIRPAIIHSNCPIIASSCIVSSDLGRQFTLVGVHPSGTS